MPKSTLIADTTLQERIGSGFRRMRDWMGAILYQKQEMNYIFLI